jgi:hypothetical protein
MNFPTHTDGTICKPIDLVIITKEINPDHSICQICCMLFCKHSWPLCTMLAFICSSAFFQSALYAKRCDRSVRRLLVAACVVPSSPIFVTLMKEAPGSSETLVLARATRRNNSEDTILYSFLFQNYWVSGTHSLSGMLNTRKRFGNWICFHPQVDGYSRDFINCYELKGQKLSKQRG